MKQFIVVAAGAVALMSGAAYAGGESGCAYSQHLAAEASQSPVLADVSEEEAKRLAELKALQEQASLEALIKQPVIHN